MSSRDHSTPIEIWDKSSNLEITTNFYVPPILRSYLWKKLLWFLIISSFHSKLDVFVDTALRSCRIFSSWLSHLLFHLVIIHLLKRLAIYIIETKSVFKHESTHFFNGKKKQPNLNDRLKISIYGQFRLCWAPISMRTVAIVASLITMCSTMWSIF